MFGGGGGGLFGDLPPSSTEAAAAAAATTSGGDDAEAGDNDKKRRRAQLGGDNNAGDDGRDRRARDDGGGGGAPVPSAPAPATKAPSLVDAIGKAGTAMAFVPAALARPRGVGTTARKSGGGGGGGGGLGTAAARQQKQRQEEVRVERAEKLVRQAVQAEDLGPANRPVDEDEGRQEEATTADPSKAGEGTSSEVGGGDDGGGEGGESEEMRTLHASVSDPYDPLVPNDYLAVREERRTAAKRKELEKEALETIKAQQEMRERIAEERRRIEATGDARLIVASRGEGGTGLGAGAGAVGAAEEGDGAAVAVAAPSAAPPAMGRGRGRGRGRGVSNLPAWLIKKQQEQEAAAATAAPAATAAGQFDDAGAASKESGRDDDGDRRLVALRNMVAPGETDDELAQEVREECEESCGPVSSVTVRDADETCPEVRVLVLFKRADDARRASKLFHGRQFAGRRVSAELVGGGDGGG